MAVGIESHYYRFLRAKREVHKSGLKNVKIIWNDSERISYREATMFYSVIYIGFSVIRKIQRQTRPGTRIVLYGLPPYPLKSEKVFGDFHRLITPFERVENEDDFEKIYLGGKRSTMSKLMKTLDREQVKDLKLEIKDAEKNWDSLNND